MKRIWKNTSAIYATALMMAAGTAQAGDPGFDDQPYVAPSDMVMYQAEPYSAPIVTETVSAPIAMDTYAASVVYEPEPVHQPVQFVERPAQHAPIQTAAIPVVQPRPRPALAGSGFSHTQTHACGGALDGEKCLVILDDHIRQVALSRPAGTVVVGNPAIADVTVLSPETLFISARSTGSTNLIILDTNDQLIDNYEIYVRTPEQKRVTLRHGGTREAFQCAPNCERALAKSDTQEEYSSQASIVQTERGIDQGALGSQQGVNPNTDADQLLAEALSAEAGANALAVSSGDPALVDELSSLLQNSGNR